jgi:predicted TIM-barrel fold metal-dependent hydrolase
MLVEFLPLIAGFRGRLLIDHCGRPVSQNGISQPGFRALLGLAQTGRASIKLSGHVKFSEEFYPYADTWPYIRALVDAFTLDHCMWGSDWPCLRTRERIDYGRLLGLTEILFPDAADRRKLFWDTPARLFGSGLDPCLQGVHNPVGELWDRRCSDCGKTLPAAS